MLKLSLEFDGIGLVQQAVNKAHKIACILGVTIELKVYERFYLIDKFTDVAVIVNTILKNIQRDNIIDGD